MVCLHTKYHVRSSIVSLVNTITPRIKIYEIGVTSNGTMFISNFEIFFQLVEMSEVETPTQTAWRLHTSTETVKIYCAASHLSITN
jgi:hypothetical protein